MQSGTASTRQEKELDHAGYLCPGRRSRPFSGDLSDLSAPCVHPSARPRLLPRQHPSLLLEEHDDNGDVVLTENSKHHTAQHSGGTAKHRQGQDIAAQQAVSRSATDNHKGRTIIRDGRQTIIESDSVSIADIIAVDGNVRTVCSSFIYPTAHTFPPRVTYNTMPRKEN